MGILWGQNQLQKIKPFIGLNATEIHQVISSGCCNAMIAQWAKDGTIGIITSKSGDYHISEVEGIAAVFGIRRGGHCAASALMFLDCCIALFQGLYRISKPIDRSGMLNLSFKSFLKTLHQEKCKFLLDMLTKGVDRADDVTSTGADDDLHRRFSVVIQALCFKNEICSYLYIAVLIG